MTNWYQSLNDINVFRVKFHIGLNCSEKTLCSIYIYIYIYIYIS